MLPEGCDINHKSLSRKRPHTRYWLTWKCTQLPHHSHRMQQGGDHTNWKKKKEEEDKNCKVSIARQGASFQRAEKLVQFVMLIIVHKLWLESRRKLAYSQQCLEWISEGLITQSKILVMNPLLVKQFFFRWVAVSFICTGKWPARNPWSCT